MLNQFLNSKLPEVIKLLKQHKIVSAYAFGSVCSENFKNESDIDLLIDFDPTLEPLEKGELWWDLYFSLKDYFQREVDLVTLSSLRNPYFIKELNETKQVIYE